MILGLMILLEMLVALLSLKLDEKKYYSIALKTTILIFICSLAIFFMKDLSFSLDFVCDQGIHLESDGFRRVYTLIIAFMWMMTMLLSRDYFAHHHNLKRYFFFNLFTEAATLGVFLAKDLYTAFIFFEIMSFTSFTWVIQEETPGAIRAANTYLAVAVIGGLTALMGIFMLYSALGTLDINKLYEASCAFENKKLLFIAGLCILVGFGAKAGMYPLHIWLPKAHPVAPAPASALLSGVLTKSGIWGILVITVNIFRYSEQWGFVILTLGTITMFLGALLALFSIDLKRTLACSSMSQIGFVLVGVAMMTLLGEENALAARGALLHMVNHSLFKLVLFMCAGVVYMNLHKLDLNEIKGFGKDKPFLMICFLLAAAGIAGIPSLNGYISKTLIHEAIVEGVHEYAFLKIIEWIFLISGGLTLAYMTKLFVCIFVSKPKARSEKKPYMSLSSYIALGGSAVVLPLLGLSANVSMMNLAEMSMGFFNGAKMEHHIHFYSLENLKGGIISIVIGLLVYVLIVRLLMMKNGKYIDLWPKKLDLEDLVYRPLIINIIPTVLGDLSALVSGSFDAICNSHVVTNFLGFISHALCDVTDGLVYLLRKTIYKDAGEFDTEIATTSFSYMLGSVLDFVKGTGKEHKYARLSYRLSETISASTHRLSDTLSFALLMMILTIVIILSYILVLYHA